mmetsp:Transcript_482/g.1818  ORF Transcript_482/g.1818 Transcript_482/m.1818 type:complete len:234 (+) Transcript_482:79-780(+)
MPGAITALARGSQANIAAGAASLLVVVVDHVLEQRHGREGGQGHGKGGGLAERGSRLGPQLLQAEQEHRSRRKSESDRQQGGEGVDKEIRRKRKEWLRQRREDRQRCRVDQRRAPRHKHEADGQALRDVVNRQRGRDDGADPDAFGTPKRHAKPDPLGERVRRHDCEEEQRAPEVSLAQSPACLEQPRDSLLVVAVHGCLVLLHHNLLSRSRRVAIAVAGHAPRPRGVALPRP